MSIWNENIISGDSPAWRGFLFFFLSGVLSFFFGVVLQILGIPFGNLFGFYFSAPSTGLLLILVSTFFGVYGTLRLLPVAENDSSKIAFFSTGWLVLLQIAILASLFFGDQTPHYGLTGRDEFISQIPVSILWVAEFYFLQKSFFRKIGNNKEIT